MGLSETSFILIPENVNSLFKIPLMPSKKGKNPTGFCKFTQYYKPFWMLLQSVHFFFILHIQHK